MSDKEIFNDAFSVFMFVAGLVAGIAIQLLIISRSHESLRTRLICWLITKATLIAPLLYFIWALKAGFFTLALLPPAGIFAGLLLTRLFVKRKPLAE